MKKIICTIFVFMVAAIGTAGCSFNDRSGSNGNGSEEERSADNLREISEGHYVSAVRPEKLQIAVHGETHAEMEKIYNDVGELADAAEIVIYGEKAAEEFHVVEGEIFTVERMKVVQVISGDVKEGESISVFKRGGYVPLYAYIYSLGEQYRDEVKESMGCQDDTDEELKEKFISSMSNEDVYTDIGSRSYLFLKPFDMIENTYERVGSYQGEYVELSDGKTLKLPGISMIEEVQSDLDQNGSTEVVAEETIPADQLVEEVRGAD